jgi:hypothetical protein
MFAEVTDEASGIMSDSGCSPKTISARIAPAGYGTVQIQALDLRRAAGGHQKTTGQRSADIGRVVVTVVANPSFVCN